MKTIKPSTVTVVSDGNGQTHMVITLELNINLNSNGNNATLEMSQDLTTKPKNPIEDFSGFEIPEFSTTEQINFGKKVSDD